MGSLVDLLAMPTLKLMIDVSGSIGEEAWHNLRHFDLGESSSFDFRSRGGSRCKHPVSAPHLEGKCIGAAIHLETMLFLKQPIC
jgi:hypothetical protein